MKKILIFLFAIASCAHAYKPEDLATALDTKNMTLKDLDLRGANLADKNLALKTFVSVDFRGANLSKTIFIGCIFIDCILVDATIINTLFQEARFIGCNLLKLIGTSKKSPKNFAPFFDEASKLTLSGNENANLYLKSGTIYKQHFLNITVSGLCLKIHNEAKNALHDND